VLFFLLPVTVLAICAVHSGAMIRVLLLMLIENNLQKIVKKEMLAASVM
jgi:hypothetical protein